MAGSPERRDGLALAVGAGIGNLCRASARNPVVALVLVALLTGGFAYGLRHVEFEENLLLILPRGEPSTAASINVSEHFPGHHSYININWKIAPETWAEANARLPNRVPPEEMQSPPFVGRLNVTDEVYLRALEEYYRDWARNPRYLPPGVDVFNVAYNSHVKLINYTNTYDPATGGFDDAAYAFPGTDPEGEARFAIDWRTVYAAAPREVSTQASPDWDVTRSVYVYVPPEGQQLDYNEVGRLAMQAFLDYREAAARGEIEWNVFDLHDSGITDAKIVDDAHGTELTKRDLLVLTPLVVAFLLVSLFLAFRTWRAIGIGLTSLVLGAVWTYGTMGYLGIKLNSLNLTIVPLLLGVGIDYTIHIVNEFLEERSHGLAGDEAFRAAGLRSGFAMFVATLTTVAGLAIVAFSPSLLVAQMGLLAALAIVYIYVLSILFVPAGLMVLGAGRMTVHYEPSSLMPAIASWVTRRRAVALGLVVVITGATAWGSLALQYETFGNPARNFPKGDVVRDWFDEGQAAFFGTEIPDFESNWVILQGDMTTPEAHRYIMALQDRLRANDQIRDDSVTGITNLVLQWQQLKRGTPAAVGVLGQGALADATGRPEADPYPQTQEGIRAALDEMYACECMSVYASLFINPTYDITVVLIDTGTGGTFEGARDIMRDVDRTIRSRELEDLRPPGVTVEVGGYTAFTVNFIEKQMPWLRAAGIASNLVCVALIYILFRNLTATLVIGALMVLTTTWWLGVLPTFGIGMAITLILPLVFISAIGSDYGVLLVWDIQKTGDAWRAFATSGKGVLYSVLTDIGAFALFIPMTNLMLRKSMMATTIAMAMVFLATMLLVPLAFPVKRRDGVVETPGP